MIYVNQYVSLEETFVAIKTTHSPSSISSLAVECDEYTNAMGVSRGLVSLGLVWKQQTHLELDYDGPEPNTVILFVDMVQNLTTLESLVFRPAMIQNTRYNSEGGEQDNLLDNKLSIINHSRIKSIDFLCYLTSDNAQQFKRFNSRFNFTLQPCLMLEKSELYVGEIGIPGANHGAFDLDFRGQAYLKQVRIKLRNCQYYAFRHAFGKYWNNVDEPMMQEALTLEQVKVKPFHMNLAWDTDSENTDIKLSNCQ